MQCEEVLLLVVGLTDCACVFGASELGVALAGVAFGVDKQAGAMVGPVMRERIGDVYECDNEHFYWS